MKRSGRLRRLTPLRSTHRDPANLRKAKAFVGERSRGRCEAARILRCDERATEFHHLRLRSQGGKHNPENLLHICSEAHRWIHANPKGAELLGLLNRPHSRNARVVESGGDRPTWFDQTGWVRERVHDEDGAA